MIKKALVFAVSAACLVSGAAFAQSSDYRNDRYERNTRPERTDHARDGRDFRYGDFEGRARRDERHDGYRDQRRDNDRYDNDRYGNRDERRAYGYNHGYDRGYSNGYGYGNGYQVQMRRGERLTSSYGSYYVVNDWQRHQRLYAPQRGYHWVQVGNDYALVAIATGIIAQVLLNN